MAHRKVKSTGMWISGFPEGRPGRTTAEGAYFLGKGRRGAPCRGHDGPPGGCTLRRRGQNLRKTRAFFVLLRAIPGKDVPAGGKKEPCASARSAETGGERPARERRVFFLPGPPLPGRNGFFLPSGGRAMACPQSDFLPLCRKCSDRGCRGLFRLVRAGMSGKKDGGDAGRRRRFALPLQGKLRVPF